MKGGPDWSIWMLSWIMMTFASALAAGAIGGASMGLMGMSINLGLVLNSGQDWLVLPVYLAGWVFLGALAGSIFLLPVSVSAAPRGLAIMAFAERRSHAFRHWLWWCVAGVSIMPLFALFLANLGSVPFEYPIDIWQWRTFSSGLICAMAGALVGRHGWHKIMGAEPILEDESIGATSSQS